MRKCACVTVLISQPWAIWWRAEHRQSRPAPAGCGEIGTHARTEALDCLATLPLTHTCAALIKFTDVRAPLTKDKPSVHPHVIHWSIFLRHQPAGQPGPPGRRCAVWQFNTAWFEVIAFFLPSLATLQHTQTCACAHTLRRREQVFPDSYWFVM